MSTVMVKRYNILKYIWLKLKLKLKPDVHQ